MINLLVEKYLNGMNHNGHTFDIFINPSKKEIKELNDEGAHMGWRFIADMDNKNLYAFSGNLIHEWIIKEFQNKYFKDLNYEQYVMTAKGAGKWFLGTVENGMFTISDTWTGKQWQSQHPPHNQDMDEIKIMQQQDKAWLKKYGVNPKSIQSMADNIIKNDKG
jgi:hypothetical protein